jgi:hypothetical protein
LYNNLLEFEVLLKLVRLINLCLNETYSKFRIGAHLADMFQIQIGFNIGDALTPLLLNLL